MMLPLYSSLRQGREPNLVALQDALFDALPTVLVCPIKEKLSLTDVRTTVRWEGKFYVVACELARPINRKALRPIGELDARSSVRIITTFLQLLPPLDESP